MDKNTKSVTSSSDCHVVHTVIIEVRISHDGMNYDQHKFFKKGIQQRRLSNVPNNHNMRSITSLEATPVLVDSNQVKRQLLCRFCHNSHVTNYFQVRMSPNTQPSSYGWRQNLNRQQSLPRWLIVD